jgi:hypothetical protein
MTCIDNNIQKAEINNTDSINNRNHPCIATIGLPGSPSTLNIVQMAIPVSGNKIQKRYFKTPEKDIHGQSANTETSISSNKNLRKRLSGWLLKRGKF